MKVKVISILQPWASLVVLGHKKIETRSWNTKYRGELFIHASAGKKPGCRELMMDFQQEFFNFQLPRYESLPFGAIIGKVNLEDTLPTELMPRLPFQKRYIEGKSYHIFYEMTAAELAFGDYSCKRYGWLLSDPIAFDKPIPAKGKLGIWEWEMQESVFESSNT